MDLRPNRPDHEPDVSLRRSFRSWRSNLPRDREFSYADTDGEVVLPRSGCQAGRSRRAGACAMLCALKRKRRVFRVELVDRAFKLLLTRSRGFRSNSYGRLDAKGIRLIVPNGRLVKRQGPNASETWHTTKAERVQIARLSLVPVLPVCRKTSFKSRRYS